MFETTNQLLRWRIPHGRHGKVSRLAAQVPDVKQRSNRRSDPEPKPGR